MTMSGAGTAGRRLGRYHLSEPLGGGPTGEVFRAKVYGVAGFERQFAVKRFHPDFVKDPEVAARVAAAARNYGSLEHPRIARLHEYGVAGGETFTAVELVEGLDLARLLDATSGRGEPLPPGAAAALVSQVARAVGYAHGRGIAHLGMCPANLICTSAGDAKVTDFGFLPPRLPRRPEHDDSLAARIHYLAPEQLAGEESSVATDVFQLGVLAYEALTGTRPFRGQEAIEVSQHILSGNLEEPPLPRPLVKVLMRCLARSPFERFPDARAMADAIDAAVRSTPLPGGTRDLASAVRRARAQLDELRQGQVSGAVHFPMPAPPRPAAAPAAAPRKTLMGVGVPHVPTPDELSRPRAPAPPVPVRANPPSPMPKAPRPGYDEELTTEIHPAGHSPGRRNDRTEPAAPPAMAAPERPPVPAVPERPPAPAVPEQPPALPGPAMQRPAQPMAAQPQAAPPPAMPPPASEALPGQRLPLSAAPSGFQPVQSPPRSRAARGLWIAIAILVAAGAGLGGYLLYAASQDRAAGPPARAAAAAEDDLVPAAAIAELTDAAPPPDAEPPDAAPDFLAIESQPAGARVYLDGALKGKTPLELDPSADSHRLALVLPGYRLHTADVTGRGRISAVLEEVTPPDGPAGIKVRCKAKNRYYVVVDGKDSGQLCPTERIGVDLGDHTVEIYDPISDTRREFPVRIKQTRNSSRIYVD